MAWFKVDDQFYDHPKVADLPLSAIGLWIKAGSYCARYETDGSLTSARVQPLGGRTRDADRLVEAGLWHRVDGGYQFHDWDQYQPTKAQQDAEREKARERMRKHRSGGTSDDVLANSGRSSATPTRPDPTRPYNTPETQTEQRFAQFWDHYPKKVAKDAAFKAWKKTIKDGYTNEYLISQAQAYAHECSAENREKRFIKECSRWFNSGAFKDDYTPVAPKLTYEQRKVVGLPKVKPDEWN